MTPYLLKRFAKDLHLSPDVHKQFMKELKDFGPKMPYSDLRNHIKILFGSKKTLSFAWQCMAVDKTISEEEEKFFNRLVKEFEVSQDELKSIKKYATRFSYIDSKDIVNEYLGRSLNSVGGGWRGKFASWLYFNWYWALLGVVVLLCALLLLFNIF